jgi:group I intron endonuclease
MNKAGIYRFINPNAGSYIGRSKDIPARWAEHKKCRGNTRLVTSLKSYGWDNHIKEIIMIFSPNADDYYIGGVEAYFEEMEYYAGNKVLNLKECGPGGWNAALYPETREKISVAHTGKKMKSFTDTQRKNMSIAAKGKRKQPFSIAHRQALSAVHKGKPWTEARRLSQTNHNNN